MVLSLMLSWDEIRAEEVSKLKELKIFFSFLRDKVLLCCLGWPKIHYPPVQPPK
jgi:hypothetical protein